MVNRIKISLLIVLVIAILGFSKSFGPFMTCSDEKPKELKDCDRYSPSSGVECCFLETSDAQKHCVMIGGKLKGYFNNYTSSSNLASFSNFTIPIEIVNRTNNEEYVRNLNNTYGLNATESNRLPNFYARCASNNSTILKITFFLVINLMILIFI